MGKRYMTLSDLYNYYSTQGKTQKFSGEDDGDTIVVQIDGKLDFSKSDSRDGLYPTRVQMNFIGDNLNGSRIQMKAQKAALPSSHYRPLLACIHDVDGEPQFWKHNMHEEDGEIVYDEQPVGVIAEEAHIEHDDEYDMDYAVALGYIWEEYSKASYILEREQRCDVSVEISIRSLSYDAKDKIMVLDDFYYSGCTILGCDENGKKINPAMPGSNITLSDFSAEKNSVRFEQNDKLIELLESLNNKLESFNILNTTKGGNTQVNKFDELLTKYEKTVDDITFEYEGLSDEELELAFSEAFEEPKKKKIEDDDSPVINSNPDAPNVDNSNDSTNPDEGASGEGSTEGQPDEGNSEPTSDPTLEGGEATGDDNQEGEAGSDPDTSLNSLQYSVTIGDTKKEFAISLAEKQFAIYCLINDTYSEMDNDFYDVDVYEESKEVVMHGWYSGKHYKQTYKTKKDVYSLIGDRVEVFAQYLTSDEITKLDNMKTNYTSIEEELSNTKTSYTEVSEKLAKYEAEPEKIQVLESEEYSSIADKVEFEELKKQENHFDLTVEEIRAKADQIIVQYAKAGALTFAANNDTNHVGVKNIPIIGKKTSTKRSRYGGLGKQED